MATSVAKKDQKKQKDRYSKNIFVETKWRNETEVIKKFKCSLIMKHHSESEFMKTQAGIT